MVPETVTQEDELKKTMAACLDLEEPKSFFLYAGGWHRQDKGGC